MRPTRPIYRQLFALAAFLFAALLAVKAQASFDEAVAALAQKSFKKKIAALQHSGRNVRHFNQISPCAPHPET